MKRIFDKIFKSKPDETHYDPTDIKITDIENGYLFDYDLETWTVTQMCEYDWGKNYFSREFKIISKGKTRYLHIEEEDDLEITIFEKIKFKDLDRGTRNHIKTYIKPPETIIFNNQTFELEEENPGYYRDVKNNDWEELISFEYESDDQTLLTIEQWDENDIEVYFGKKLKGFEIDNILPNSNN